MALLSKTIRIPPRWTPLGTESCSNRHDESIAWMRRRLRTTMSLGVLLMCVQTLSAVPLKTEPQVERSSAVKIDLQSQSQSQSQPKPKGRAVPPVGWRRTAQGWQHVSTWGPVIEDVSLSQRIVAQRDSQAVWLYHSLAKIRRTPPGCFAIAQLLCVGILLMVARFARVSVPPSVPLSAGSDQTCPSAVR